MLNCGKGQVSLDEVLEMIKTMPNARVQWELSQSPEEGELDITKIRLSPLSNPETSASLLKVVESFRLRLLQEIMPFHHDDMSRFIKLWVWKLLSEREFLEKTSDDEQEVQKETIVGIEQALPQLVLELTTLFSSTDLPMSFRDYRLLSSRMTNKIQEIMEKFPPAIQGYFMKRIAAKSRWKGIPSLLMQVQTITHYPLKP